VGWAIASRSSLHLPAAAPPLRQRGLRLLERALEWLARYPAYTIDGWDYYVDLSRFQDPARDREARPKEGRQSW
jgi:hypothetical protein